MMNWYFLMLLAVPGSDDPASHPVHASAKPTAATTANFVVKVSNREQTAEALVAEVTKLGGYFTNRSEQQIVLRVPVAEEKKLFSYIDTLGTLLQRDYSKQDLAEQLDAAHARVRSLEAIMKRYLDALSEAGPGQVVVVEREIVSLIQQLESAKLSAMQMERRAQMMDITVSFQFRERNAPARDGHSSFGWINSVNLFDLVEDFKHAN